MSIFFIDLINYLMLVFAQSLVVAFLPGLICPAIFRTKWTVIWAAVIGSIAFALFFAYFPESNGLLEGKETIDSVFFFVFIGFSGFIFGYIWYLIKMYLFRTILTQE